jgi:P-type Cu+ transporter
MRWLAVCVLLVACARDDRAEQSAKTVATKAAAQPAPSTLALAPTGCGTAKASCNGGASCGGQCGGATADAPVWAAVPPGAHWTELRVTGMHCGGCARRIERALAKVDGVLGVKIDVPTGSVKVATAAGADAKALATAPIDALGYRVQ